MGKMLQFLSFLLGQEVVFGEVWADCYWFDWRTSVCHEFYLTLWTRHYSRQLSRSVWIIYFIFLKNTLLIPKGKILNLSINGDLTKSNPWRRWVKLTV